MRWKSRKKMIGQKLVAKVLLKETTQTKQLTKTKMFAIIGSQINASLDRDVNMNILQDAENIWIGENVKRKTAN